VNMRRAMQINRHLCAYATAHLMDREERIGPAETFLRGVSLLDMAEATEKVTRFEGIRIERPDGSCTYRIATKCGPRIVAAIYALLWFDAEAPGRPEPIIVGNRCALFSVVVPWPPTDAERVEVDDGR